MKNALKILPTIIVIFLSTGCSSKPQLGASFTDCCAHHTEIYADEPEQIMKCIEISGIMCNTDTSEDLSVEEETR